VDCWLIASGEFDAPIRDPGAISLDWDVDGAPLGSGMPLAAGAFTLLPAPPAGLVSVWANAGAAARIAVVQTA